jgi:hypothetical protein
MNYVLFGQMSDPNIAAVRDLFDVFVDQETDLTWDLQKDRLFVDGEPLEVTAFFGRSNVFSENSHQKYSNWYLFVNFLASHPEIKRYNKHYNRETPTKALNLYLAKECGLLIPKTIIGRGPMDGDCIVKPLTGGAHCASGNEAIYTAIVQERIPGTNRRLFLVGNQHFGFKINTTKLDYRDDPNVTVDIESFDDETVRKVRSVSEKIGLTFCAADFMDDVFLEINSGPMFSSFDRIVEGAVARAIRNEL